MNRFGQCGAVAIEYASPGRGQFNSVQVLFIGLFFEDFVLKNLEVERPPDYIHEQEAEHSPDHDDPDTCPFFPLIFHLT